MPCSLWLLSFEKPPVFPFRLSIYLIITLPTHLSNPALPYSLLHKRQCPPFLLFLSILFLVYITNLLGCGKATSHTLQSAGKLWVLLLNLKLGAGCLGVGQGVNNLTLSSGELGGTLKVLERLVDFTLLEEELSHSGNSNIALWVNCNELANVNLIRIVLCKLTDKSLLTKLLSLSKVLLPLEEGKSLVDQWKNVHA